MENVATTCGSCLNMSSLTHLSIDELQTELNWSSQTMHKTWTELQMEINVGEMQEKIYGEWECNICQKLVV